MDRKFIKGFKIYIGLTFWIFILAVGWAAFRRILLLDESSNLLLYDRHCQNIFPSTFHLIVIKLFGFLPAEIYVYRLLSLGCNVLSSIIFTLGFLAWLRSITKDKSDLVWDKITVFLFIAIGNLITFFIFSGGLGYNSLNNTLILISSGCILWTLGKKEDSNHSKLPVFICGILAGIDFFVKFPASILFLLCAGVLLKAVRDIIRLNIGFILGMGIYFIIFEPFGKWLDLFTRSLAFSGSIGGHGPDYILQNYALGILANIFFIIIHFSLPLLLIGLGFIFMKSEKSVFIKRGWQTGLVLGIILLINSIINTQLYKPRVMVFYITIFLIILILQAIIFLFSPAKEDINKNVELKKALPVIIFLFFLPFMMAFGTNIPIVLLAYGHIMPWFALFILISVLGTSISKLNYKLHLIPPALAVFFAWSYFLGIFMFNEDTGIAFQNYKIDNISRLKYMRVDYPTKKFIENCYSILVKAGYKKGNDIIAFDLPFFAYAFDANAPGSSWYSIRTPQENCRILESVQDRLKNTYFILPSTIDPAFFNCIKKHGVFENHKFVGYTVIPYDAYNIKKGTRLAIFKPVD